MPTATAINAITIMAPVFPKGPSGVGLVAAMYAVNVGSCSIL